MATFFVHGLAAYSGQKAFLSGALTRQQNRQIFIVAFLLSVFPDFDVIGYALGVEYSAPLGHRGFSHSLVFCTLFAYMVYKVHIRFLQLPKEVKKRSLFYVYLVAIVSHPIIDMLTNGGLGIAFWAPFTWDRVFLPWAPIPVSPFTPGYRLLYVFLWECFLVLPLALAIHFFISHQSRHRWIWIVFFICLEFAAIARRIYLDIDWRFIKY